MTAPRFEPFSSKFGRPRRTLRPRILPSSGNRRRMPMSRSTMRFRTSFAQPGSDAGTAAATARRRAWRRLFRSCAALLASGAVFAGASDARAHEMDVARPAPGAVVACSASRSVCVHAPRGIDPLVAHVLGAAEHAFLGLEALDLPRPLHDLSRGGTGGFDVYLDPTADAPRLGRDPSGFDAVYERSTAFVVLPVVDAPGCRGRHHVAAAIASAGLVGIDASTDPATLTLAGDAFAASVAPCSTLEIESVDTFQRAPERTLTGDGVVGQPGSWLFSRFLDARYGNGVPGRILASLVAIGGQRAVRSPVDEPDPFDALRATQRARGGSLADTLLDFAVDRAFLGTRDDDAHLPDVAYFGDLGRPRIEWSVAYTSLPRRLAPARAVEPLGATYVWIDLAGVAADAELTLVTEWEKPVLFRWTLVKVGADGSEKGRVDIAPVFGEFRQERTMRDLVGLSGVLVVGVNEGEESRNEPFDPGVPRLGPRSYLLTVYGKLP